jgi:hypothetical protein
MSLIVPSVPTYFTIGLGDGEGDETMVAGDGFVDDDDDAVFVRGPEGWLVLPAFGRGVRVAPGGDAALGEEDPTLAEEALGDEVSRDLEE